MKEEENVLNVLMYLFQNHMNESHEINRNAQNTIQALREAGFEPNVINEAIHWLETLVTEEAKLIQPPQTTSMRVLSNEERQKLDATCFGFILSLEQQGILSPTTRETVIKQLIALENEPIDISLVKWVVLLVLFNRPNAEKALTCMEFLVLDNASDEVH